MSENNYPIMQQDNAKGATALQAQVINVYPNGITEEKCREICLSVYKDNIMSLQDEAKDIAYQRAEQLTDKFVEKLSKQNDDIRKKIEEQLKEPAMQEAIFKSQKCYALSNDEDHLTILTNMLIDRGHISQRTNKQMLIDDAIDIMPRLNQKHLDILGYMLLRVGINQSGTIDIMNSYLENLVKYMKKIVPISKEYNDFIYLRHKNCLKTSIFANYQDIKTCIFRQTQAFNEGFEKEEIIKELNRKAFENFFMPSLKNPNKYVLKFNSFEIIEKHLNQYSTMLALEKIKKFYIPYKNNRIDNRLVYDVVIEQYPDAKILFDNDTNVFSSYQLTPLGQLIAIEYISRNIDKDFLWDFE